MLFSFDSRPRHSVDPPHPALGQRLAVPRVISAEHLTSGNMDNISMMTYIACFRKALMPAEDTLLPPLAQSSMPAAVAASRGGRAFGREPSGYMDASTYSVSLLCL